MVYPRPQLWLVVVTLWLCGYCPIPASAGPPEWVELRPGMAHPYDLQVEEDEGLTTVRLRVHGFNRGLVAPTGSRFESVTVPGAGSLRENGRPELPTFGASLLMEAGAEVVSVERTTVTIDAVVPAPFMARPARCTGKSAARLTCDTELYNGQEAYPESSLAVVQQGQLRGHAAMTLELRPFRFFPAQRKLEVAVELKVILASPLLREANARLLSKSFDALSRSRFHQLLGPARDEAGKELLLIVVHDDLLGAVDEFVAWKEAKGYAVVVMTLSAAGSNHTELKATLQEAYDNWPLPPTYLLLVGDGNGAGKVPFVPSPYGCASDFLFSTLDGDDLYSDVLVGRVSAHTAEEASLQLGKAVWYERDILETGDGDWVPRAICLSSSEGSGGSNDDVRSDIICDLKEEYGISPADRLYHSNGMDKATIISGKIEEGRGWLTYLGHGSGHSWSTTEPPYGTLEVAALQNQFKLPFVVDVSCSNGEFDSDTGDCFAEVWMKAGEANGPRGAVAIYSASMVTPWDEPAEMAVGMTKAALQEGILNWSALAAAGRAYMMEAVPGGSHEEVSHQYVVFGDPSLQVRTALPKTLDVTHPPILPLGSFPFLVEVTSEGLPLGGTTVVLSLPGGGTVVAKTASDGKAELQAVVGVVGEATLTVSAANAVPYQSTLETLVPGCGLLHVTPVLAQCEGALNVQLFDADLNVSPTSKDGVVVSAASDSSPQGIAVALLETELDSGKFVGELLIGPSGDGGSLNVGDTDTVTVSYFDEACEDGAAEKATEVVIDCTAPALSDLNVDDVTSTSATVSFVTDEFASGAIRFGTFEPLVEEALFGGGKSHSIVLSGLSPDSEFLAEVYLQDVAGNESTDDNNGGYYTFATLSCSPECAGKQCGPDGCGGLCGGCCESQTCEAGACLGGPGCEVATVPGCSACNCEDCVCDMDPYCCQVMWDDLCVEECLDQCGGCGSSPACGEKECGPNGCGGVCGECPLGWDCTDTGKCVDNCVPDCAGSDCGTDGCGGNCGTCGEGAQCVEGACLQECGGIDFVGCCDGDVQYYCEGGFQLLVDCAAQGLTCGWKATLGWYDCNETSQPDPSGTFPLWCPGICPPECDGKECGPDGCGGTCGECQEGEKCVNALCVGDCEPDCDGQSCGDDGCGGQCECQIGMVCYFGQCVNSCIPQCTDLECGDDGCEGLCGQCAPGMSCSGGQCILGQVDDDVREESDTLQEIAPNAAPASGGCSARGGADSWGMLLLIWLVLLVALSRRTSRA